MGGRLAGHYKLLVLSATILALGYYFSDRNGEANSESKLVKIMESFTLAGAVGAVVWKLAPKEHIRSSEYFSRR